MKTLRIMMLTAALAVGGMGSAYARDSFGLSVNIGIPGYYAAPPAVVYHAPPTVVYYEEPVRYYYGAPTRIYYSEPRHYYGHDRKWRGHEHNHHRHHRHDYR